MALWSHGAPAFSSSQWLGLVSFMVHSLGTLDSLGRKWRGTESKKLEVQCDVSPVSDAVGCHAICWGLSTGFHQVQRQHSHLPGGPCHGDGLLLDCLNGTVGQNVLFKTTLPSPTETPFSTVSWRQEDINIITSSVSDTINPIYLGRINLTRSTGSLELFNLTLDDSGQYDVFIQPQSGFPLTGECTLHVFVRVSNVTITDTSDTTYPLEFSSSVSLSCSVSTGSSLSYRWTNASSEVTASSVGVQLDHGGSTLTILNLTRYDRGPYTCQVSNPVSGGASESLTLNPSCKSHNPTLALTF
ncbi:hypothetical protein NHX12_001263 [Muraenolepis orangiensis]|uniref:Ig-like domain-containing protein n=1 Tax=Muraenolepis orangiensis TaxID=630683 RepID=A0A9Q0II02_9TELE|nr:hypothetical protein NHX12_001263 [Muraenolepis orangiensis]